MSTPNKGNCYVVKYRGGSQDDCYTADIFVTNNKDTAKKYVKKFNSILGKWKKHYEQFETNESGIKWIADEHVEKHFDRWYSLQNIIGCYYEEAEIR